MLNNLFNKMTTVFASQPIIRYVCVCFILAIAIYIIFYILKKMWFRNFEGLENNSQKQMEMLFFLADWCGHCKTAKPEVDKFISEYNHKMINGRVLDIKLYETGQTIDNETEELMKTYDVTQFPTVLLEKDNNIITFTSKVTFENLVDFVNQS
jgi:thiol-disulfide isomerase/thioredoxin